MIYQRYCISFSADGWSLKTQGRDDRPPLNRLEKPLIGNIINLI